MIVLAIFGGFVKRLYNEGRFGEQSRGYVNSRQALGRNLGEEQRRVPLEDRRLSEAAESWRQARGKPTCAPVPCRYGTATPRHET